MTRVELSAERKQKGAGAGAFVGLSALLLWTLTLNDADNEVADTVAVVVGVADTDCG